MSQAQDLRQRRVVACTLDSRRDALHYSASVEVYKMNDSISCALGDKDKETCTGGPSRCLGSRGAHRKLFLLYLSQWLCSAWAGFRWKLVSCIPTCRVSCRFSKNQNQAAGFQVFCSSDSAIGYILTIPVHMCLQVGAAKYREHEHSDECLCSSWPMATGHRTAAEIRRASE